MPIASRYGHREHDVGRVQGNITFARKGTASFGSTTANRFALFDGQRRVNEGKPRPASRLERPTALTT